MPKCLHQQPLEAVVRLSCYALGVPSDRSHQAARAAQRLCSQAATAFSDEAETIMESKRLLEKLLEK